MPSGTNWKQTPSPAVGPTRSAVRMADLDLPYFRFYVRDWLADQDVRLLSLRKQGALVRLMCSFWAKGSLPSETEKLARLVGVGHPDFVELWSDLRPFFEERTDGRLEHRELAEERRKLMERRQNRSEAGKKGARERWGDEDGSATDGTASGGAKASSEGKGQTAEGKDGSQFGGRGEHGGSGGAKGTGGEKLCPQCEETRIDIDLDRCSRCRRLSEAAEDSGTPLEDSDLPF